MTYTVHGRDGLTHFVFQDGSVLVSHRWGEHMLAVDPFDDASWRGYRFHMEVWGAADQVLTAMTEAGMMQVSRQDSAKARRARPQREYRVSATRQ